jgi:hypothetical protein
LSRNENLTNPVKSQGRTARAVSGLSIPELDATDTSPVARQINDPRPLASADSIAHLNLVIATVFKVDHHALKLDGRIAYFNLKGAERSPVIYRNRVAISRPIDVRLSEILPSVTAAIRPPLRDCRHTQSENQKHQTNHSKRFSHIHSSSKKFELD